MEKRTGGVALPPTSLSLLTSIMTVVIALTSVLGIVGLGCRAPEIRPTVSTGWPSATTGNGATLNGDLTSLGTASSVEVHFEWGTSPESYLYVTTAQSMTSTGSFSDNITGLNPGTTYYYRAKAVGDGTSSGLEYWFKTP